MHDTIRGDRGQFDCSATECGLDLRIVAFGRSSRAVRVVGFGVRFQARMRGECGRC
jgi:hypothetical protein